MRNIPATLRSSSPKGSLRRFFTRRLWLPGVLYAALPFLYLLLGAAALASGIYMPDPGWIIGYLLLISAVCLHAGIWFMLLRRRRRHARLRRTRAQRTPGTAITR
ncbi:MAG: hypothetical protein WAU48_11985 [Gammaproteobacteria bacterium]